MPDSRGFLQELIKKIKHRILPPLLEPEDFLHVINFVFYKKDDYIWVEQVDRQLWIEFFELLSSEMKISNDVILQELHEALHIVTNRAVTLGLEREIIGSYVKVDYHAYPFFLLDQAVEQYLLLYNNKAEQESIAHAITQIVDAINNCKHAINKVSEQRKEKGTSLAQTYLLIRIEQHLGRLLLITDVLNCDNCFNAERFASYFIRVIKYEKKKSSIREFISTNIAFLSYKITEHGGKRGKKYMTITRKEYWAMLRSSMGGGFIVSFTALIKNLLSKIPMPPFWLGFAYSLNYTAGFQAMHETRTTLATKQPAFTASAIASSVDYYKAYEEHGLYIIAIIIARTARTQLASFFGNLVVVFPVSYGLAALYYFVTGQYLLNQEAALLTLEAQHPLLSLSVLYACFTGVLLFLSGLIAGYVENGIHFGNVGERLTNHPFVRHSLSSAKLHRLTRYVENNMGALVGNIALGFFLGMSGVIGKIFGIPFDIRHITIASGNAAMAYFTTGNAPGFAFLLTVFMGILLIGMFNFLVSFALAFFVALRSRGVRLRDYPQLLSVVAKYFTKFPTDFFYPPKSEMKRRFD
jgi:site-specific recombinase